MRVTDKMTYDQVIRNLQKNRSQMNELQSQAATQKRVTKPSDDPTASARILGMRSDERQSQQFIRNIQHAKSFLEATETALSEATELLIRLKELAIQQANDAGASAETRRLTAEEVAQSFQQLVQIGNRKIGERFLFGGTKTTIQPFSKDGSYQGDDRDIHVQIQKEAFVPTNMPGDRVFLGRGLGADGYIRPQSEVPGQFQDLLRWQEQETLRQKQNEEKKDPLVIRGLASTLDSEKLPHDVGVDVFQSIKNFEISLRVNDKEGIQRAIADLDLALSQITTARSQVGARLQTLQLTLDSLQKNILDQKATTSFLEDVDLFQLVSDMGKTESTLKASLETSSRVVQPSLLDFLR